MLKDIVEYVQQAARLPEITGERCVHALTEQASCQACVDVCPHQAWLLDDDSLGLIEVRCDGCALCVPACPQQAIEHSAINPVLCQFERDRVLLCACEKTQLKAGEGLIPCVHALGLHQILSFYRQGCRQLLLCSADCDDCARGGAEHIETRLQSLNDALQQSGQPLMDYQFITTELWQSVRTQTAEPVGGRQLSRRRFFRRAATRFADAGLQHSAAFPRTLGQLMPAAAASRAESSIWPHVPVMDASVCNGCDACIKLCSQQALQVSESHYHISPASCSGCGVCADVCDQRAITVRHWQTAPQTDMALHSAHCRACGADFHYPSTQTAVHELCRICRQTRHYQALYQVYS